MRFCPAALIAPLAITCIWLVAGCNSVPRNSDGATAAANRAASNSSTSTNDRETSTPDAENNDSGSGETDGGGGANQDLEVPPGPTSSQLNDIRYPMRAFEKKIDRAYGRPLEPDHSVRDAQRRIDALREKWGDHASVMILQEELDALVIKARGSVIEVTPEMLAYRGAEQRIVSRVSQMASTAWQDWKDQLVADGAVGDAFPAPNPEDDPDAMIDKVVIVEKALRYPYNMFGQLGSTHLFLGGGDRGIYYVNERARSFLDLYESLRRYRGQVSQDVPQPWTMVGRVTDITLLTPVAGEMADHAEPQPGWVLEPMAIYVPGKALAWIPPNGDGAPAVFVGEDEIDGLLSRWYTVKDVPAEATPQEVVEAYITVVKEKNQPLFRKLIHPDCTRTEVAENSVRNAWQRAQEAFATRYVHARVQRMEERPGETVAWLEVFNDEGKLARSVFSVTLRQADDGTWRMYSGLGF